MGILAHLYNVYLNEVFLSYIYESSVNPRNITKTIKEKVTLRMTSGLRPLPGVHARAVIPPSVYRGGGRSHHLDYSLTRIPWRELGSAGRDIFFWVK